jgi:multiple sugar transport system permease protein
LLASGLVALFWAVNAIGERLVGAIGRATGPVGAPLPKATRRRLGAVFMYLLVGGVLLFELFPYYFVVVTAFKSELQIQRVQSMFWPNPWVLDHFVHLFTQIRFVDWYRNTVVVAASSTVVSVLAASLGAYGLVRLRWRGARVLGTTVLVAYLMPGALMFIPMYLILAQIGEINSLWALLLTYPSFVLPFATWLMMGYYRSIPEELEDAAMIDGCNRLQAFWWVVLPLARPAVLAVALLSITQAWNEFLYAYAFIWDARYYTLQVGLAQLIVGDIQPWGLLMAASLLTALPVVVIYMLGQRFMVAGLAAGSVKG